MNISQQTISQLNELYYIHFQDEFINVVSPELASEMYIGFERIGSSEIKHIGKTIKATKKETTFEYVLDKINADKLYKNFSIEFNKIVSKFGFHAYATSYGIGVFVAVGFRSAINESKLKIETELNNLGIVFTTEYSEAGWVFRYKISKSAENIKKIESILTK